MTVSLGGTGTTLYSSSAGCGGAPIGSVAIAAGQSQANLSIRDTAAESQVVSVASAGWTSGSLTLTVYGALTISPAAQTIAINAGVTFSGSGGASPYAYAVFAGGGSFTSDTGIFAAPGAPATVTVRVTDNLGATSNAVVTVMPQALVELHFEENSNNWTWSSGSSNSTHTRAVLSPRAFPVFNLGHPAGTRSLASVDFGDGTGWGADLDGAIDLVSPGGLQADFYDNTALTPPLAIQRIESPILSCGLTGFKMQLPTTRSDPDVTSSMS